MCRLLGWAARDPVTVRDALGEDELAAFAALSRQHVDGWGMAWWPGGDRDEEAPLTERSTLCAAEDPRFAEFTTAAIGDAGFGHLRWATHGLAVVPANTHPFTHGSLAFAHNGAIHPQERLDQILPREWESQMRGTTDSERYFLAVVAGLQGGATMLDAVAAVVDHLYTNLEPTSLNAMLLAPDALYVISAHDSSRVPALSASSGGESASSAPDRTFYDLHLRRRPQSVVVASSGFPQPAHQGWEPLGNMRLLRIERGTLATTVSSLVSPAHSPAQVG